MDTAEIIHISEDSNFDSHHCENLKSIQVTSPQHNSVISSDLHEGFRHQHILDIRNAVVLRIITLRCGGLLKFSEHLQHHLAKDS
jgi:hypothetical protein